MKLLVSDTLYESENVPINSGKLIWSIQLGKKWILYLALIPKLRGTFNNCGKFKGYLETELIFRSNLIVLF